MHVIVLGLGHVWIAVCSLPKHLRLGKKELYLGFDFLKRVFRPRPPPFLKSSPSTLHYWLYHILIFSKLEIILAVLLGCFSPLFPGGFFLPSCSDLYKFSCIIVILECPFTTLLFHDFLAPVLFCFNLFAGVYIQWIGGKGAVEFLHVWKMSTFSHLINSLYGHRFLGWKKSLTKLAVIFPLSFSWLPLTLLWKGQGTFCLLTAWLRYMSRFSAQPSLMCRVRGLAPQPPAGWSSALLLLLPWPCQLLSCESKARPHSLHWGHIEDILVTASWGWSKSQVSVAFGNTNGRGCVNDHTLL